MNKLKELEQNKSWISKADESSEIASILRKIDVVNNASAYAVREKRDKVMERIYDQQKRHVAINAYNKLS